MAHWGRACYAWWLITYDSSLYNLNQLVLKRGTQSNQWDI